MRKLLCKILGHRWLFGGSRFAGEEIKTYRICGRCFERISSNNPKP